MNTEVEEKKPEIEVEPYSIEKGEVVAKKRGRRGLYAPTIEEELPDFSDEAKEAVKKQVDSLLATRRAQRNKDRPQEDIERKARIREAAVRVLEAVDKRRNQVPATPPKEKNKNESTTTPQKKPVRRYVEI